MTKVLSRRKFIGSGAAAAALAASSNVFASAKERPSADHASPIRLGLASYTFRNFTRAQTIGFMKQLNVRDLNAKDVKDHLPTDPQEEAAALADYSAAGIRLHAAGTIYFAKDEDADIRAKFEYCKRAGIAVIVAGDPTPETLPRIEKFVKEYDIRIAIHNHGPEDKLWHSPLDVLKAVKSMDPRIGCCIDVGHTARAGTDVVRGDPSSRTAAVQRPHEGPDGFSEQGEPGRGRRGHHAGAEDVRSAGGDKIQRLRRSRV